MNSAPMQLVIENSVSYRFFKEEQHKVSYAAFKNFGQSYARDMLAELSMLKHYFKEDFATPWPRFFAFYFLCFSGGLVALASGFNGMYSVLLSLYPGMILSLVLAFGVVAALSALAIFIAQDKPAIAENLEIYPELEFYYIDDYLFHIQKYVHALQNDFAQDQLQYLDFYLGLRDLLKSKQAYNHGILQTYTIRIQLLSIISIAAFFCFSDTFFVGQNLAFFLGQLVFDDPFIFSVISGTCLGLLALAYFWGRERPSLEQFLEGEWFTDDNHTNERLNQLLLDIHELEFASICVRTRGLGMLES